MSDELRQQLKDLSQQPEAGAVDQAWMQKNKALLMMQVKNTCAEEGVKPRLQKVTRTGAFFLGQQFSLRTNWMVAVRPLAVLALVVLIPMGGWVSTVNASLLSVSGDTLYGVKIMSEKMQLSFASNKKDEIALRTEFAARRADEVIKLQAKTTTDETAKGHIQKTIKRLEEEIKTVSTELDKLAQEQNVNEVIEVVRTVDEKNDQIAATLGTAELKLGIPEIEGVKTLIDSTSVKAVETVVHKLSEVKKDGEYAGAIDEHIKFTIEGKLKDAATEINNVLLTLEDSKSSSTKKMLDAGQKTSIEEKLKAAAGEIEKALVTLGDNKQSSTPKGDGGEHQETQDVIKAAKEVVEKATQAIQAEDFEKALAIIKEVQLVVSEAKKTVAGLQQAQADEDATQVTQTESIPHASSTPEQPTTEKQSEGTVESDMLGSTEQPQEELPKEEVEASEVEQANSPNEETETEEVL